MTEWQTFVENQQRLGVNAEAGLHRHPAVRIDTGTRACRYPEHWRLHQTPCSTWSPHSSSDDSGRFVAEVEAIEL